MENYVIRPDMEMDTLHTKVAQESKSPPAQCHVVHDVGDLECRMYFRSLSRLVGFIFGD